jgi:transcriptional regulator of nitric oxide reductase
MNVNKDGFTLRVVTSLSLPSKARLLIHEIPRLQPSVSFPGAHSFSFAENLPQAGFRTDKNPFLPGKNLTLYLH